MQRVGSNGLVKTWHAAGAVPDLGLVVYGAADGTVAAATGGANSFCGVCVTAGGVAAGARLDVMQSGLALVVAGGVIAAGAQVTANAQSRAVAAVAPCHVAGVAQSSAVAGDELYVLVQPAVLP